MTYTAISSYLFTYFLITITWKYNVSNLVCYWLLKIAIHILIKINQVKRRAKSAKNPVCVLPYSTAVSKNLQDIFEIGLRKCEVIEQ